MIYPENSKSEKRICNKCFKEFNFTDLTSREICGHSLNKNDCVCKFNRDIIFLCKNCNELFNNILKNLNDFFNFVANIKRVDCEIIKQDQEEK